MDRPEQPLFEQPQTTSSETPLQPISIDRRRTVHEKSLTIKERVAILEQCHAAHNVTIQQLCSHVDTINPNVNRQLKKLDLKITNAESIVEFMQELEAELKLLKMQHSVAKKRITALEHMVGGSGSKHQYQTPTEEKNE
jgi:hypothetical protein